LAGPFILSEEGLVRTEWVYSPKKITAQKIKVEYFSFCGGDLAPLSVVK